MLVLLRITVPPVVLVRAAPLPARIALIEPLSRAKDVPVRTLVVPVMLPLVRVTAPTVLLKVESARVPPLTSKGAPVPRASSAEALSVPRVTVVWPV